MANISLLSIWVRMPMEGANTIIVLQTRTDVQSSGYWHGDDVIIINVICGTAFDSCAVPASTFDFGATLNYFKSFLHQY